MKIFNIYHKEQDTFVYVGNVEANSLEMAYAESQNHEWPWNIHRPCRSTSIGDIIECDNHFYTVEPIGFQLYEEPEEPIAGDYIDEMYSYE